VINLQEEDADDYTCVAVNAGGVSEQNVSLTFDTPALEPNREEPPERDRHFSTLIAAVVGGKEGAQRDWWRPMSRTRRQRKVHTSQSTQL
jgi:hypothetical protein